MPIWRHGEYHTPSYPRYIPSPTPPRMLAWLEPGIGLHTEMGECVTYDAGKWQSLADAIYSQDMQVYADNLKVTLRPMLPDIIWQALHKDEAVKADGQWCEVYLDEAGGLIGVGIHRGRNCRHITLAGKWMLGSEGWTIAAATPDENTAQLGRIRSLCERAGTGIRSTPGAVGATMMMQQFKGKKRHHRPTLACIDDLERWSIGGRNELYAEPGIMFDSLWRHDLNGAYPSFAGRVPAGRMFHFSGLENSSERQLFPYDGSPPTFESSTWFARCLVQIDAPGIAPGDRVPFGFKRWNDVAQQYEIIWPTAPGIYGADPNEQVWLWREQAEELRRLQVEEGVPIHILWMGEAYAWKEWSDALLPWVDAMERLRLESPTPAEAKLAKLAAVAGIGRSGVPYHETVLVEERDRQPGDKPFTYDSLEPDGEWCGSTPWYVHERASDPGTPKHWHAYIIMRCCLLMSQAMHQAYRRGDPSLACMTDCYWTRKPEEEKMGQPWRIGGWKVEEEHLVVGYAAGHIHSLEEQRMPGVPDEQKRELYRWGERRQRHRKHLNEEAAAVRAAPPLTPERYRKIHEQSIAPFYRHLVATREQTLADVAAFREAARRASLEPLHELAESMAARESWRLKWAQRR